MPAKNIFEISVFMCIVSETTNVIKHLFLVSDSFQAATLQVFAVCKAGVSK